MINTKPPNPPNQPNPPSTPQPANSPEQVWDFWSAITNPNPKHDDLIRQNLQPAYELAAAHQLDSWADVSPQARVSLTLLLDQVPRHLYRQDARAYATDLKAQFIIKPLLNNNDQLQSLPTDAQLLAILPFIHAENVASQQLANKLMISLAEKMPQHPLKLLSDLYLQTIQTFGFFPHRKATFGLPNTPAEKSFLQETWSPQKKIISQQFRATKSPST